MSIRRPVVATTLIVGAIFTAGVVGAASLASASSVALHKSDVPAGYTFSSKTLTNAGMVSYTGIPKTQFDQHGRITGLQNTLKGGSFEIISFVSQYRTAAGAVWEYGKSSASDLHHGRAVAALKVDDRSIGFTQSTTSTNGSKIVGYGVDFQKGVYDMTAVVLSAPGKASISLAGHYAQIMAGRAH